MKPATIFKRLSCALLALTVGAGMFISCDSNEEGGDPSDPDGVKVYSLASIRDNCADYTIVRGDESSQEITDTAILLKNAIKESCGAELPIATDWDGDTDNSARLEILVGATNREASSAAIAGLAADSYTMTEDDKGSIVIAGSDDSQTMLAAKVFLGQYFGYTEEESVTQTLHNVRDYGAAGDNKNDDTEAFRAAVKAAESDGLPVYVPAGTYLVTDTITLNSVTLYGYNTGAWTADTCDLPTVVHSNMQAPLFNVCSGSVAGLNLDCKGNATSGEMSPTVLITGTGGRVSNMRLQNPYIGIYTDDTSNPGRCFIDNIFIIQAYSIGVYVAGTYDVPAVNNVEVWNPAETCPIAFKFGHNDDLRAVNLFAFNANVGFSIEQTETGYCWGSFTNCSVDYTSIGFRIGTGTHHVTIVGGTYWTHHMGINVVKDSEAYVAASGCELKSNGERTLNIEGGKTVTVSGCSILHDFESDAPAVAISGGTCVTITGNSIYSYADAIRLSGRNGVYSLTGNSIYTGGVECRDQSRNCVVKLDNAALENQTFTTN